MRKGARDSVKLCSLALVVAAAGLSLCDAARAFELPPVCATAPKPAPGIGTVPVPDLRHRVEAESETDPAATVSILCATIPRVAQQYGERSVELAWWVKSLTMPMIA